MKEPEGQSPRASSSEEVPERSRGAVGEARVLLRRGMDEVGRHSESGREAARGRGGLARVLLVLTLAACLLAVGAGVYGVYKFPDAPIRQAAGGYVGKYGKPHTREEFEAFVLWRRAMLVVFPSAFVLGFAFVWADGAGRRERES